jgi:hypothetical protein
MLKRAVATSRKLSELKSDSARLLYTWLLPFLDVEGKYYGEPDIIKGAIVPRLSTFSSQNIEEYLQELAKKGLIYWYQVEGDRYLRFTVFDKHQNINKDRESKSQIPDKSEDSGVTQEDSGVTQEDSGVTQEDSLLSKVKLREVKLSENKVYIEDKIKLRKDKFFLEAKNEKNFSLNSYFKLLSIEEYTRLLNEKQKMLDWNIVFSEMIKAYPMTSNLEVAVQEYLKWLYSPTSNKPNGSPIKILKSFVCNADKGLLPLPLQKKDFLDALGETKKLNPAVAKAGYLDMIRKCEKEEEDEEKRVFEKTCRAG